LVHKISHALGAVHAIPAEASDECTCPQHYGAIATVAEHSGDSSWNQNAASYPNFCRLHNADKLRVVLPAIATSSNQMS
jgi:hypothetical protein